MFNFVAGTVCKSSAHYATLKMAVILSLQDVARIQTSRISCNMLRETNSRHKEVVHGNVQPLWERGHTYHFQFRALVRFRSSVFYASRIYAFCMRDT